MKTTVISLLFLIPAISVWCQEDTICYFGVNGRIANINAPEIKKEIDYISAKKVKIETYKLADSDWQPVLSEKIRIESEFVHQIKITGNEFSGEITRVFEKQNNEKLKFTDWLNDKVKRTGTTLSEIPLIFDGEVTEFYKNGNKKSSSLYKNNELVSNRNWLENGDPYIDSIFYSVDREPRYPMGISILHEHIRNTFLASEIDLSQIGGRMVVGFVVMETGKIDGFRIEEGIDWRLNGIAQKAFLTLPGTWQPARLNGEKVRFYQLFPINFIYHEKEFEYLELKGRMFNWGS